MSIRHTILSLSYRPLAIVNSMGKSLGLSNKCGRLRVLLFHDIAPNQYELFKHRIEWLSRKWKFVDSGQFGNMLTGKEPVEMDSLLLTFDDGFCSDRVVAEKILNPMGIRALFFVISEFSKLEDRDKQLRFISENLFPGEKVPENAKLMRNMSIEDLKYLVDAGHTIGSHTTSHRRLSTIAGKEALVREIVSGADWLQDQLNVNVDNFAFSFGNLESFSREALNVARERFPYIYTGLRGDNSRSMLPWAIRRDAVTVNDSLELIGAFTEGAADFRYKKSLETYESWGGD